MQMLLEFLPIALFFVAYKFGDLFIATGVLIAAVLVQSAMQWLKHRKLSPMMLTSAVLVLIFGGLTLFLHDATFIKWKPTILYALFAVAFTVSRFIGDRPLIERVMGENIQLPRPLWNRLNTLWTLFFLLLGGLNLFVAYQFDESTWVNFKLFGLLGLTVVFALLQSVWLSSQLPGEQSTVTDADEKS
jgi:intracellular septation protein